MEKKLLMFLAGLFLCVGTALAQTQIKGTVISSSDGEPVAGATIKEAGTNNGTITDVDGKFVLSVKAGAKLTVQYIGMETQTVTARNNMRIELNLDAKSLDEVMVVAYGTAKKSAFTGSAAVVGSEELSKKITTNVADALVGSVSGLQMRGSSGQPGASQGSINIRGIASMYAGTDPLVIVDGAPYSASLSNIPTSDIESVTVLKDAASAALYGARGAAGVIIITTKKAANKEGKINVDMKWGSNSRAIPEYDVITNPGDYYSAVYSQYYNNYFYNDGLSAEAANVKANSTMLNKLAYNVYSYPDGEQLIGLDGKLNPNATLGREVTASNGETYWITPDDWSDAVYRNSLRQEYNVNASGGTDRSSYYASLGYLNDEGIIKNTSFERISARVKADYQVKKWLKVGANVGFTNTTQDQDRNSSAIFGFTSSMAPIFPLYLRQKDANGNLYIPKDSRGLPLYDLGSSTLGIYRPYQNSYNPIASNQYDLYQTKGHQLNGTFNADIQITDFLKANLTSTITWGQSNTTSYYNPFFGSKTGVNGSLTKSSTENWRQNHTQTITYYDNFGKHGITAMVGHEYYKITTNYLAAQAEGGFSPSILQINAFAKKKDSNGYESGYNVEGYFGNAQYNYDNKYFGSLSYRRDASSRFAKENRWGSFWSVGGAWLLNKEEWFNASWVDELKLKASIGQQGNDNIGNWAYVDLYTIEQVSDTEMSASFYRLGNKEITWETTTNFNVGTEFSFWKGRLSGSFDFYTKKVSDLLFWLRIPESQGSRGYYSNVGDLRNTGVELTLTGHIIRTKDFDWSVTANAAHNTTKILKLSDTSKNDFGGFSQTSGLGYTMYWYKEGGSLYNGFMHKYAGVNEQGQALFWVDEDVESSQITGRPGKKLSYTTTSTAEASMYETGSLLPKVFGGLSTTITYKGFDATFSFDYQIGGKVFDMTYANLMSPMTSSSSGGYAIHKDYIKSWSPNNTSSSLPRWSYGDTAAGDLNDRFLTNAGYFNFQAFTVGYTFPKNWIPYFSNIRVYCAGENLGFISARKGLDPRYSYDGVNGTSYSPTRNISGGIQLTF